MHAWARKISESENLKPEMFVFTIKFCRACSSAGNMDMDVIKAVTTNVTNIFQ